jgi:hypothetical protein
MPKIHNCKETLMRHPFATKLLVVLVAAVAMLGAAENPIAGTWQCAFVIPDGGEMLCTLAIQEEAGKLTGTIAAGGTTLVLEDLKLEGDAFGFKFSSSHGPCAAQVKVAGKKLQGTWSANGDQGEFKGEKQS